MPEQSDLAVRMRRLEDLNAIRELKARYFRYMDTRDWAAMLDVFTADAVMDMRAVEAELAAAGIITDPARLLTTGRDAIVPNMENSLVGTRTVHHGHMPEIELESDDEARGIWPMEDIVELPTGAPVARIHGYGHYIETYVREKDGHWRIQHLRLVRLLVENG